MDWARAKSIMLFLLVALNLFLLVRIVVYDSAGNASAAAISNTEKILEKRGVTLECNIPQNADNAPALAAGEYAYDGEKIAGFLLGEAYEKDATENKYVSEEGTLVITGDNRVVFSVNVPGTSGMPLKFDIRPAEKYIRSRLEETGLIGPGYVLDQTKTAPDGGMDITFIEKYNGLKVFDNYIKVKLAGNVIAAFEAKRRPVEALSPESTVKIYPAYQVLLKNLTGNDGKMTITDIDFGYAGEEIRAVWRVKTKEAEQPLYFDASAGI